MNRCAWPGKAVRHDKPWGHELTWNGVFQGKEIHIKSGCRTSLKFNTQKNEVLYVQAGKIFIEFADEGHLVNPKRHPARSKTLSPGELLNVQAGCPYRLSAIEDSVLFEISDSSTSHGRVIIEDDYGRSANDSENKNWIFIPPVV